MTKLTNLPAAILSSLLLTAAASSQAPQDDQDRTGLSLRYGEAGLRVTGGFPDDICGILLGTEQVEFRLPGGALLGIQSPVVAAQGRFDARGEFLVGVAETPVRLPITVLAQAITVVQDSTSFATSNVMLLAGAAHAEQNERADGGDGIHADYRAVDGKLDSQEKRATRDGGDDPRPDYKMVQDRQQKRATRDDGDNRPDYQTVRDRQEKRAIRNDGDGTLPDSEANQSPSDHEDGRLSDYGR